MTTTSAPTNSNRGFLLALVGLVVAGLAIVAVVATTVGGDDGTPLADDQTAEVTVTGDALAGLPNGVAIGVAETDPVVGQTAPSLIGTDFAGDEVAIEADGRPKAVYFLAHWCPHCQDEVPAVQSLIDAGVQPDGLDIYAVSTAVDAGSGNYPPQAWLEREGFEPTVVRDDAQGTAFASFGGGGFPYVVFLDGDNQVVARAAGNLDDTATTQLWELTAGSLG
ncbi:MAG: TlpA disulfide reductase family protein [Actinomycetota bacterium]